MDKRTLSFLQLRDYLKNLFRYNSNNLKWTDFNKTIAKEISKYLENHNCKDNAPKKIGAKTIESILTPHEEKYDGRSYLQKDEVIGFVKFILNNNPDESPFFYNKFKDESGVLFILLRTFLKDYNFSETEISELLSENKAYKDYFDSYFTNTTIAKKIPDTYSNMPERYGTDSILLKKLNKDLHDQLWEKARFVFLQGFHGTGKNYIALTKVNDFIDAEEVYYSFFIDCHNNYIKTPVDFYKKILFFLTSEKINSLPINELSKKAADFLFQNNAIIYIEAFESIQDEETQKHIIGFLSKYENSEKIGNLYVIITSNKRKECFSFINDNLFSKLEIQRYNKSDLHEYLEYLKKDTDIQDSLNMLNEKQKQDLDNFLLSNTIDLTFLKRSLFHIAKKIKAKEDLEKIKKDFFLKEIYDFQIAPYNYLEELSNDSRKILITLLLFSKPVSKEELSEMTELNDPELTNAIIACYNRFFIDTKTEPFFLSDEIWPLVAQEHNKNYEKYTDIHKKYDMKYRPITK
ncbi:MAG: hypothetical protein MJ188_03640 [Treponema sp.]|nr:hypothetical protein [Treponema sp.]